MRELTLFYLPNCPHCKLASRLIDELCSENADYARVPIKRIDESADPKTADAYDYWYVPCFYLDGVKLHEGHAERADVQRVLDAALAAE